MSHIKINILKWMIWIGSGNICGRDEIGINILIIKSDDKIQFETNIHSWDLIVALGMDVRYGLD